MKPRNQRLGPPVPLAMQRTTNIESARSRESRRSGRSGWLAFALGMAAMFALLAVWVVLVEMRGGPEADVEFIGLEQGGTAATASKDCDPANRPDCR